MARAKKEKAEASNQEVILAYKGFDKDLSCRGFQYEIGKTYHHQGKVEACLSGFHACTNPFDVWNYYNIYGSRFAEVELSGTHQLHGGDTKVAAATITIKAEIKLPDFINRAVDYIINLTKGTLDKNVNNEVDGAKIGSSGYSAKIGSSGNYAKIGASGDYAKIGASGDYAQIGSSGNYAKIGASGYSAQIGASGNYAKIGASGYSAQIGSSGNYAKIGASGDYAQINSSGENAVIASAGSNTIAKGVVGSWIALAEFDQNGKCIGFATGCIGENGLRTDTWYRASGGKLVECN